MSKLPDRPGILISPLCGLLAGSIFGALLVSSAMQAHQPRRKVSEQMLYALAKSLGLVPSIAVAAVLTVSTAIWLIVRYRRYHTRFAEDRQKAGLT